ncbi:MAG: hypothetical protein R3E01_02165 [Pirellulaceae bacterium]
MHSLNDLPPIDPRCVEIKSGRPSLSNVGSFLQATVSNILQSDLQSLRLTRTEPI